METDSETHSQTIGRAQGVLWNILGTEPPSKQNAWAGARPPYSYVADAQFILHVGPLKAGANAVSDSVACL